MAKNAALSATKHIKIGAPFSAAKRLAKQHSLTRWNNEWLSTTKAQTTRNIFPSIPERQKIKRINHNFFLTQTLTGHGKFKYFLNRMNITNDPYCRCGSIQTSTHILNCNMMLDLSIGYMIACLNYGISTSNIATVLQHEVLAGILSKTVENIYKRLVEWERTV